MEYNFTTSKAMLMTLNVSKHLGRLLADFYFTGSAIYSKTIVNDKPVFDRNLTLIDHVSIVYYWESG